MEHNSIIISELNCFPVKSCGGVSLQKAIIGPMGIKYDRQWMFVNEDNVFVAQRGHKKSGTQAVKSMCHISVQILGSHLVLNAPNMPQLWLLLRGRQGKSCQVRVWDSYCLGIDQGEVAAKWATDYLSREVPGNYKLVRMPDHGTRHVGTDEDLKVSFADAYPFLIISQESLWDLNKRIESSEPLLMNRFRPNIVLSGVSPYFEDIMRDFFVGGLQFCGRRLCVRCPITTIDQETGSSGKEPLKTLATYRYDKELGGVVFGRNFVNYGTGRISVGDVVAF